MKTLRPKSGECGIFIDLPPRLREPSSGDLVVTRGARGIGSAYLIIRSRRVHRRKPHQLFRYVLRVRRVPVEDANVIGANWELRWYSRKRRDRRQTKIQF